MALFQYQQTCQLLISDIKMERVNVADLLTYINIARNQVAGEGECIRNYCALAVTAGAMQYPFSAIAGFLSGVQDALKINQISYQIGATGNSMLQPRNFSYFNQYYIGRAIPPFVPGADPANPGAGGPPYVWSQYGQGVAGTIWINYPDNAYTLNLDCVCLPIPLVDDSTVEAIPALWTDAIPWFAIYYAAMSQSQSDVADKLLARYQWFMSRARQFANPTVLFGSYSQAPDPFRINRLGVSTRGGE